MFNERQKCRQCYHKLSMTRGGIVWSGLWKFRWPYISVPNGLFSVEEDSRENKVSYCDVEIDVGRNDDMQEGFLARVTLKQLPNISVPSITNMFERLATDLWHTFLWRLGVHPEKVRWYERYSNCGFLGKEMLREVSLEWDEKEYAYSTAKWSPNLSG